MLVIFRDLVYFTAIWSISWPFGLFYGHLVYFTVIWYILWPFDMFFPFWNVLDVDKDGFMLVFMYMLL
jgi:hypothetical protein